MWANLARYLLFANITQNTFFLQESCKLPNFCKTLQDISCLQEHRNTSYICKSFVIYLLFVRISQAVYFLQESCKMTLTWKILARYLVFARTCKISFVCNLSQVISFLQETRKFSNICKTLAKHLLFAKTTKGV